MTSVKSAGFPKHEQHLQMLLGLLFERIHDGLGAAEDEGWDGLRRSHLRVVQGVPAGGTNVTDLASRVGLTKQGCGQLVTQLVESGHLSVETGAADARVRLVRRTDKGERAMKDFREAVNTLEGELAREVGRGRYREFRAVLEDLALGG